jgi:hypothetical protein
MVAGEKAQLKLAGAPAHESEIGALNGPDCPFAVTVRPPDAPAASVSVAGAALKDTAGVEPPPPAPLVVPPHEEL